MDLAMHIAGFTVLILAFSFGVGTLCGHALTFGKDRVERDAERRGL